MAKVENILSLMKRNSKRVRYSDLSKVCDLSFLACTPTKQQPSNIQDVPEDAPKTVSLRFTFVLNRLLYN